MGKDKDSGNTGNFIGTNYGNVVQSVSFGGVRQVSVNGKEFSGQSVEQRNGRTFVDGKDVTDELGTERQLTIIVQANVERLEVQGSGSVTVTGTVGRIKTVSGNVEVSGNVTDSVESISGSISCGQVSGSVKTVSGSISHR